MKNENDQTLNERIDLAVRLIMHSEFGIGDALREAFPEAATGDEDPEAVVGLTVALNYYIKMWVAANVPSLLTRFCMEDGTVEDVLVDKNSCLAGKVWDVVINKETFSKREEEGPK